MVYSRKAVFLQVYRESGRLIIRYGYEEQRCLKIGSLSTEPPRSRNDGSLQCGARCAIADRRTKTRTRTTTVDDDDGTRAEPYREFSRPAISELMMNLGYQRTTKRVEYVISIFFVYDRMKNKYMNVSIPGRPLPRKPKTDATGNAAQAV